MPSIVLVTGFGPFGEHTTNASWETVKHLPTIIEGCEIIKEEIPVVYTHVEDKIPLLWKTYQPLLVIHVGVSSFTTKFTIETCAYRKGYLRIDCSNEIKPKVCSSKDGKDCILTEINVEDICKRLNTTNLLQATASDNAGRYLCEFTYYTSLNIDNSKTLFIHVPPIDKPYSVEVLAEALTYTIKYALLQVNTFVHS